MFTIILGWRGGYNSVLMATEIPIPISEDENYAFIKLLRRFAIKVYLLVLLYK